MRDVERNTAKELLDTSGNRNLEVCKFFSPSLVLMTSRAECLCPSSSDRIYEEYLGATGGIAYSNALEAFTDQYRSNKHQGNLYGILYNSTKPEKLPI
jgi:hypothetical protein